MRREKVELTEEFIRDYWLKKGHNIDTQWLIDNEPELIKTTDWYKKYAVSQTLHDEWYDWSIETIVKNRKISKKLAKRRFCFDYLNLAPSVIEESPQKIKITQTIRV